MSSSAVSSQRSAVKICYPLPDIRRWCAGFTLIELLVVIAVIALLAAILFPVLLSARLRAQSASCQSNLRQIGLALDLYVHDFEGCYPNTGDPFLWMGRRWRWVLMPYLAQDAEEDPQNQWGSKRNNASLLLCPSDTMAEKLWDSTSYAYSMAFYHSDDDTDAIANITQTWTNSPALQCVTRNRASVKHPSQKAVMAEWLSNHTSPHVGWNSWDGARNYLFADGHTRYLLARQVRPANDGFPDINATMGGLKGRDVD